MCKINIGSELKNGLGVVIGLTANVVAAVTSVDDMGRDDKHATWLYDIQGNTFNGHYGMTRKEALIDMASRSH